MIKRDFYLNQLAKAMWNGKVKLITGIRGCGKSVLLFDLFYEYLLEQGVAEDNVIKISLDQVWHRKYRNPVKLCDYVDDRIQLNRREKFYLFIDEIQLASKLMDVVQGGYDLLKALMVNDNLDIYVTCSNRNWQSTDIVTDYSDRTLQIEVFPLSFDEYYALYGGAEKQLLESYLRYGGMPALLTLKDDKAKQTYLSDLCRELYKRDVAERSGLKLKREEHFGQILDFLAMQTGYLTSAGSMGDALTGTSKDVINPDSVSEYMQHACDSFLISTAKLYDVASDQYYSHPNKYYYTDLGLCSARLNFRQYDFAQSVENVIYNELLKRGYSVDVGVVVDDKSARKTHREIDFVVSDAAKKLYIQSALSLQTEEANNPILSALALTNDGFKKVVIRTDITSNFHDEKGIFHCNLIDFLLNRVELF